MKKVFLAIAIIFTNLFVNAQDIPSVIVKNVKGENVNFADVVKKNRITVVSFWATWCVPCKKEINNIAEIMPEWKKNMDFDFLAVSIDDTRNIAKVKSYVNGQRWDFTTLIDPNQDLKRALNFQSVPYTIVYDQAGKIAFTHSGYVEGDEFILKEKIKELLSK
jgi:cytochrome c biogenesis protein CcmG/thiol:disulfide interchange protein DsbE